VVSRARNILIIASLYGSKRVLGLARYLPEFGWSPTIITPPVRWQPTIISSNLGLRKVLEVNGYEVVKMVSRTHRLAILTAVGITVYGALKLFRGERISKIKSAYVETTDNGLVSRILSMAMKPVNWMSERGLRGMELIAVARKTR
jgi:hypothetical protein